MYGARVLPQAGSAALHIFGTPLGSCPPGSALRAPSDGSSGSSSSPASSTEADLDPFAGELGGWLAVHAHLMCCPAGRTTLV